MNRPLRKPKNRRRYWELKNRRLEAEEKILLKILKRYFEGQKERILERMPQSLSKDLAEQVFNKEREQRIAKELTLPALQQIMEEEGIEAAGRFGGSFMFTSELDSWLDERTEFFTKKINETTYDQLSNQMREGVAAGESYDDIARRVSNQIDEISEGRARTIARTEVHSAQQKANFEGYRQVGVESKIWVAAFINTRDTHAEIDGEEVPIDRTFSNGLMFPGDVSGPPAEVINCNCSV